ncbi:hypothetical protein D9M72_558970 [compost metagenome]
MGAFFDTVHQRYQGVDAGADFGAEGGFVQGRAIGDGLGGGAAAGGVGAADVGHFAVYPGFDFFEGDGVGVDFLDVFALGAGPGQQAVAEHLGIFGNDGDVGQVEDGVQVRRDADHGGGDRDAGAFDFAVGVAFEEFVPGERHQVLVAVEVEAGLVGPGAGGAQVGDGTGGGSGAGGEVEGQQA